MEENGESNGKAQSEAGDPGLLNTHKVKVQDNNGSSRIDLPKEIQETVNIQPGDIATVRANESNYGRYVEIWVPKKQRANQDE